MHSCREPAEELRPWQRSRGRRLRHTHRWDRASGNPLFPSTYPQNQSLPTLLCHALTYTSDFMGAIPHHLYKGVNLELQIINLLGITRMFQVKPLSWQTSLCDRIIHTLAATYMIDYYLSTINSAESLEYFENLNWLDKGQKWYGSNKSRRY